MFDRIFAPTLTFLMLIGGTAAIASGLFATSPRPAAQAATEMAQAEASAPLMLDKVTVVVRRADAERALAEWDQRHQARPGSGAAEGRGVMLHAPRD